MADMQLVLCGILLFTSGLVLGIRLGIAYTHLPSVRQQADEPPSTAIVMIALVVLSLAASPVLAQTCPDAGVIGPRLTLPERVDAHTTNIARLCAALPQPLRKTRIVTVSSVPGEGDYTTISAAFAYVASQSPTVSAPWTVLVFPGAPATSGSNPGNYVESTLSPPAFTTVQGASWYGGMTPGTSGKQPVIRLTCTSGTCLSMTAQGVTFNYVYIVWKETPTAAVKVVEMNSTGNGSGFYNSALDVQAQSNAFAVDAWVNTVGASYFTSSSVSLTGNALGRVLVNAYSNAAGGITVYGGRFSGTAGCPALMENTSTATFNLYSVRLGAGCTVDLKNVTTGAFNVFSTAYGPVSGTITNGAAYDAYGTSNPATCSPGQRFLNTTTPAQCSCVAANTWKCITIL